MATRIDSVLRERFGLEAFRPWQREAIEALLGAPGRVLVVAPTGGGKSLTYQLPAVMLDGLTLVVSPLVALMEDQVRSLVARGIRATYLASVVDLQERQAREAAMIRGEYDIVYVAPERLANDAFVGRLARCELALVAVDEAHCIAQWGHDFRPEYLQIGALLERLSPPRVLACTATATEAVRGEIRERLGLGAEGAYHEVLRGFARPNLHLAALYVDGPREVEQLLMGALEESLGAPRLPRGGAIVYCATRKTTERYVEILRKRGWNAAAYHAGMSGDDRSRVADRFARRKVDIVVATNAFGMGIDRPDIRIVVHVQPPASIEAYYQEVGRAGRDGSEARGLLLCSGQDIGLRRRLVTQGGDGEPVEAPLAARAWKLFRELLSYLDARTCRHDFVLRYFGDDNETLGGCGHCDVCLELDEAGLRDDAAGRSVGGTGMGERGMDGRGMGAEDEAVREETLLVVKKALSAVARANRRGGLLAIAEMLHGDASPKIERFGFTTLSTFGLLRDRPPEWIVALLRGLLAAGWIDLTSHEHPVPYLTKAGLAVMKGETVARFVLPPLPRPKAGRRRHRPRAAVPAPEGLPADDLALFEKLRTRRSEIAKQSAVPPYVVAHDKTLIDMAQKRPQTRDAILSVHGMGPARVEQYGDRFLEVLLDGVRESGDAAKRA